MINLQIFDLRYFLVKNVFGDDGFQNRFVYQETLNKLQLREDNGTDYVFDWKSKELYASKLIKMIIKMSTF